MRALGVALAVCSAAVLYPTTAQADSIRAKTESSVSAQSSEGVVRSDDDADDATFKQRSGLERSLQFANLGFADVFADGRTSFCNQIDSDGFGLQLKQHITIALRTDRGHGRGKDWKGDREKKLKKHDDDAVGGSPNPEPASVLLIATGVGGLLLYRRQLLA